MRKAVAQIVLLRLPSILGGWDRSTNRMLSVEIVTSGIAFLRAGRGRFASVLRAKCGAKPFAVEPVSRLDCLQDANEMQPGRMAST
jgi:hypothetical protein